MVLIVLKQTLCPQWATTDANGNKIYPGKAGSKFRWVMTEGASASGNIASSCAQRNCKYNFSNNTIHSFKYRNYL